MEDKHGAAKHLLVRRPEDRLIKDYAVLQGTLRKFVTGVAYLSLTWSTVVLLGGFVSQLKLIDFWFLTAISTSFAVNLADAYEYKTAFTLAAGRLYIGLRDDLERAFSSRGYGGLCLVVIGSILAEVCFGVLVIVFFIGQLILLAAPGVAILLALRRLLDNSYGDAGGDAAGAAKLKASLQIFYSLALAQNILFCFWSLLLYTESRRVSAVSRECGFGKWGSRLVRRYARESRKICAAEGNLPQGRNLVTFAVTLLGSGSLHDRRSGVRLLDTFVGKQIPVGANLLPFKDRVDNLMEALEVGDAETRERAARVVVALAGDLRHIDQFPTALHYIASLLEGASDEQRHAITSMHMQEDEKRACYVYWGHRNRMKRRRNGPVYWGTLSLLAGYYDWKYNHGDDFPYGGPNQLISQGLLIIERIALYEANCEHICNNPGLLSRITAPLNSRRALLDAELDDGDSEWVDILSRSLRIVARLISAPGKASRGLRNGIATKTQAVANLTRILEDDRFGTVVLKTAAIEILAELSSSDKSVTSLGRGDICKFIGQLWGIFLREADDDVNTITEQEERQQAAKRRLRHKAGEALARMLSVWDAASSSDILEMFIQSTSSATEAPPPAAELLRHVVGQLTGILVTSTNRGCRTRAAEILARLCSHFATTQHRELPRQDVIIMLTKVLQLMILLCIPRETDDGTGAVGANNDHAAQNDVENPRPPGDHTGNNSQSSSTENEEQREEKEFVVALLSLAVVICDRMVDEHDFTCAASGDMLLLLATKLKEIIETNNDTTVECLSTVKLSCQLIVSMVQLKPSCCIQVFMQHNFQHVLSESSKALSNLDNCMLFDDDYHRLTKTDKPLASLVKQAQECFHKAQELGNSTA